jgi:hypothetical protein
MAIFPLRRQAAAEDLPANSLWLPQMPIGLLFAKYGEIQEHIVCQPKPATAEPLEWEWFRSFAKKRIARQADLLRQRNDGAATPNYDTMYSSRSVAESH